MQTVSALYVLKNEKRQMWKDITNVKNKCKSRSCVWWLVLNLSWYKRKCRFLLNFDISFVSITVSTFETVIITEVLTIPFSLCLLLCDIWQEVDSEFAVSNFELTPQYLRSLIPQRIQKKNIKILVAKYEWFDRTKCPHSIICKFISNINDQDWNSLDLNVKNSPSLNTFKLQISRSNGDNHSSQILWYNLYDDITF